MSGNSKNTKQHVPDIHRWRSAAPVEPKVVHAHHVHQSLQCSTVEVPRLKQTVAQRHHRQRKITYGVLVGLLLGTLSFKTFLPKLVSPHAPVAATLSQGRVLGAAVTVPLNIPVTITHDHQTQRIVAHPLSGTVVESLTQVAAVMQSTFTYTSRGSSIYLQEFLGLQNSTTATWKIFINGAQVTDLTNHTLEQGDDILLTYTSL